MSQKDRRTLKRGCKEEDRRHDERSHSGSPEENILFKEEVYESSYDEQLEFLPVRSSDNTFDTEDKSCPALGGVKVRKIDPALADDEWSPNVKDAKEAMNAKNISKLVELVKSNDCLWDVSSKCYKDIQKRNKLWAEIGAELNLSGAETCLTFRKLREKYSQEYGHDLLQSRIGTDFTELSKSILRNHCREVRVYNMDDHNEIRRKINAGVYHLSQKQRRKSSVWILFAEVEKEDGTLLEGFVCCRTCKNLLKFNGKNSSNLNRHKCFASMGQEVSLKPASQEDKKCALDVFSKWMIEDCQPFAAVDGTGFRNMVDFLVKIGSRYGANIDITDLLPDSTMVATRIKTIAEEKKIVVTSDIQKIIDGGEASVAIDLWTDNYIKKNFLCATLHFYKNCELTDVVLGIKSMAIMRSSEVYISDKLQTLFGEFNVHDLNKIVFVTPSENNLKSALQKFTRIDCSNHLLSNILDSAFQSIEELIELIDTCKKLIKNIKKQHAHEFTQTSLKSHCTTRWMLHLDMFRFITDNWSKINEVLAYGCEMHWLFNINLTVLQPLVELCTNFETISEKLQSSSSPSICFVLPSINRIRSMCAGNPHDVPTILALKSHILTEIEDKWAPNLSIWHKAAFFLYPPANYLQENDLRGIKDFCLKKILERDAAPTPTQMHANSAATSSTSNSNILPPATHASPGNTTGSTSNSMSNQTLPIDLQFFFPELLRESVASTPETPRDEVERYARERIKLDADFDVIKWWEHHSADYPNLSKFALRILTIPASSSASERVFALASNIITEKSNRLASKSGENMLFLNSSLKNYK